MAKIGYLRVSTKEQRPDRQRDRLAEICDELYVETVSAGAKDRPVYRKALKRLQPGDTFVVLDLDRAFRSTVDALIEAQRLCCRGVHFEIVNLRIDTKTPGGFLVYTVISAYAEFERKILAQRTREGLAAARSRGVRLGRPPSLNRKQIERARRRLARPEATLAKVAAEFGVSATTLSRALKRAAVAVE